MGAVSLNNKEDNEVMKAPADMKSFFLYQIRRCPGCYSRGKKLHFRIWWLNIRSGAPNYHETEDNFEKLQKTVNVLESRIATLSSVLDELENRNHCCNLCLVNLPEKVKGKDAAKILFTFKSVFKNFFKNND